MCVLMCVSVDVCSRVSVCQGMCVLVCVSEPCKTAVETCCVCVLAPVCVLVCM